MRRSSFCFLERSSRGPVPCGTDPIQCSSAQGPQKFFEDDLFNFPHAARVQSDTRTELGLREG